MVGNLLKRALFGASAVSAGYGASYLHDFKSERNRAYYGEKEYNTRLAPYEQAVKGTYKAAGWILGAGAMFARNPMRGFKKAPYKTLGMRTLQVGAGAGAAWGTNYALENPLTAIGVGAATSAIPLGIMGRGILNRYKGSIALGAGIVGAGAYSQAGRSVYPAAEDSDMYIEHNRASTSRRLNYSTAGLPQSLHKNRRIYQ